MPRHIIVTVSDDLAVPQAHEHVFNAMRAHRENLGLDTDPVRDVFPVWQHPGVSVDGDKVAVIEVEPGQAFKMVAPKDYYLRLHEMHGDNGDAHMFEITVQPIEETIKEHGFDPRPTPRPLDTAQG